MDLIKQVNRDYKDLLEAAQPGKQMEMLTSQMKERGMDMHGTPFPTFLKPYFVEASDRHYIATLTSLMAMGLEKIGYAYLREGKFKDIIELDSAVGTPRDPAGRMADLVRVNPGYPRCQVVNRYDLFFNLDTKALKFIEFNCGDPSGMGWNDDMLEIFYKLPVILQLSKKYDLTMDRLLDNHHRVLRRKYEQYCLNKGIIPDPKPNIAIVCWRDSTILGDFKSIVRYYKGLGYNAQFADPSDFDYDGKKLSLRGTTIHLLYRDAMEDFVKDNFWPNCQAIIKAYRDGNVCFVNPVHAATSDFKAILEIMTEPKYEKLFTPEERAAHKKHIPWTRLLRERKTQFHGKAIDLVPYVRKHRALFALKPNSGYGGFGAVMGWLADQKTWDETIQKALTTGPSYAVQERVEIPVEEFPVMESGKLKGFEPKYVNINFWVHDGAFAGSFVRAAASQIVNVHQGGGLVPLFFVSPKN
jgi:hypothetical protein